jgi:hypothetical protein
LKRPGNDGASIRTSAFQIHFPSVVCTSSPNATRAYGGLLAGRAPTAREVWRGGAPKSGLTCVPARVQITNNKRQRYLNSLLNDD